METVPIWQSEFAYRLTRISCFFQKLKKYEALLHASCRPADQAEKAPEAECISA